MTLLITVIAAVICTVIWYANEKTRKLKISTLCFMYWGASLMWLMDFVFEYAELKAEYFNQSAADILNDSLLGVTVVTAGLVIWLAVLLCKDPKGVFKDKFVNKKH